MQGSRLTVRGNSREEYLCYCSLLKDEQYVEIVYEKYPGLRRYLKELEVVQLYSWRELLGRLVNDWDQIKAYFQMEPDTRIRDIRRSGSDFHCRGRSVVIVETDRNKEILYKPHSLENEIFLQGLLADIHTDLGMGAFRYLELERGGYGWVEKVVWQECTVGKGRWHMPINCSMRLLENSVTGDMWASMQRSCADISAGTGIWI